MRPIERLVWWTMAAAAIAAIASSHSPAGADPIRVCGEMLANAEREIFDMQSRVDNARVARWQK